MTASARAAKAALHLRRWQSQWTHSGRRYQWRAGRKYKMQQRGRQFYVLASKVCTAHQPHLIAAFQSKRTVYCCSCQLYTMYSRVHLIECTPTKPRLCCTMGIESAQVSNGRTRWTASAWSIAVRTGRANRPRTTKLLGRHRLPGVTSGFSGVSRRSTALHRPFAPSSFRDHAEQRMARDFFTRVSVSHVEKADPSSCTFAMLATTWHDFALFVRVVVSNTQRKEVEAVLCSLGDGEPSGGRLVSRHGHAPR